MNTVNALVPLKIKNILWFFCGFLATVADNGITPFIKICAE